MSEKTIEIISIHKGNVRISCKGESRTVRFEDRGDVGIAMCDHDEATVFMKIGSPDYWKAGATTDAVAEALKNDPVAAAAAAKLLGGGAPEADAAGEGEGDDREDGAGMTIKQVAELIKACATIAEVDAQVADDKRIGVLKAAAARKKELAE